VNIGGIVRGVADEVVPGVLPREWCHGCFSGVGDEGVVNGTDVMADVVSTRRWN
jgi:hypothetical protein